MSPSGLLVMIISVGSVLALVSFCLYRVLSLPPVEGEDIKGVPLSIDKAGGKDSD